MKCPKCDAKNSLRYREIQQFADEYKILGNGTIGKRRKFVYIGPEEWSCLYCIKCGSYWTGEEFNIEHKKIVFMDN